MPMYIQQVRNKEMTTVTNSMFVLLMCTRNDWFASVVASQHFISLYLRPSSVMQLLIANTSRKPNKGLMVQLQVLEETMSNANSYGYHYGLV